MLNQSKLEYTDRSECTPFCWRYSSSCVFSCCRRRIECACSSCSCLLFSSCNVRRQYWPLVTNTDKWRVGHHHILFIYLGSMVNEQYLTSLSSSCSLWCAASMRRRRQRRSSSSRYSRWDRTSRASSAASACFRLSFCDLTDNVTLYWNNEWDCLFVTIKEVT